LNAIIVNSFKGTLPNLIEMEVNFAAGEEADEDDDDYYIDEEIMDEYNDWHYNNAWQGDGDGHGGDSDGDGDGDGEEEYSYGGTFGYTGSYY
jgi:hypothetical protein